MKKLKTVVLEALFEHSVDGGCSNAYAPIVVTLEKVINNIAFKDHYISLPVLLSVLTKLSDKWEEEIDKAIQ